MLNLQIVSDLHLEFRQDRPIFNVIEKAADILVLCGDICPCNPIDINIFKRFINEIKDKYKTILFIPGNHEYYNNPMQDRPYSIDEINIFISDFCNETNGKLLLMINRAIVVKNKNKSYLLVGSTLWSYIAPVVAPILTHMVNDYNKIYISSETALKPQYTTQMFMHNLAFIREMHNYATKENIKMVLLTHHQPYIFNPKGMRSYAYMTDLTDLFDEQVILVAHGHTHEHRANTIKSTKIYSNPLGYPNQDCGFNRNEKISIM